MVKEDTAKITPNISGPEAVEEPRANHSEVTREGTCKLSVPELKVGQYINSLAL